MPHNKHHLDAHHIGACTGAAAELLKQGGYLSGHVGHTVHHALTHNHLGHHGAQAVQSLASYAPAAVMTMGTVAPPLAIAAGVGYGVYKLFKWLSD
jgi:hypothetical protein